MTPQILQIPRNIYIIDDNRELAEDLRDRIVDMDFNPRLIIDGHYKFVPNLLDEIEKGDCGVLCDHRLQHGRLAEFYGSQLVAALYDLKLPALLLTQFSEQDVDTTIRKYRRKIPSLIARSEIDDNAILEGLSKCIKELNGDFSDGREPHRCLIEINYIDQDGDDVVVDAFIPAWRSASAVRFPVELMGLGAEERIRKGLQESEDGIIHIFAEVNIGADISDEFYFENFEWPNNTNESALGSFLSSMDVRE
ncbi:hypothetical protein K7W42_16685 [Deinococcus sp. HMF7604]|uniref:hypothetical protein n=1 Tax=Deinococcus betulae TaxID=2873312 RepID=UPI001CCAE3A4|nr:hypothetical protein [Deinococcus betulae]MBZ9752486.1 hypothetical protein [Deinococcus betulae]